MDPQQAVSLTADDALEAAQTQLNAAMSEFDRWVSQNPNLATRDNTEFRLKQQNIKLLRLKLNEIRALREDYQNTLMILSANIGDYIDPNIPTAFTKQNNSDPKLSQRGLSVVDKRVGKVSAR